MSSKTSSFLALLLANSAFPLVQSFSGTSTFGLSSSPTATLQPVSSNSALFNANSDDEFHERSGSTRRTRLEREQELSKRPPSPLCHPKKKINSSNAQKDNQQDRTRYRTPQGKKDYTCNVHATPRDALRRAWWFQSRRGCRVRCSKRTAEGSE